MMENIIYIDVNFMFCELYKFIVCYWLNYEGVFYVFYLIFGVVVVIVGIIFFILNGFIFWMFYR